jgi:hypothetical protein
MGGFGLTPQDWEDAAKEAGGWLVNKYFGDGKVTFRSTPATDNIPYQCENKCAWKDLPNYKLGTFELTTYAFTKGIGYVSESFDIVLVGEYDGCNLSGVTCTVSNYDQTFIGRHCDVHVRAISSPLRQRKASTGCLECCKECAVVRILIEFSGDGWAGTLDARVFGDGSQPQVKKL